MSLVQAQIQELQSVEHEIKHLSSRLKALRDRKKDLEAEITTYIQQNDLPGVRYQGKAILVKPQTKFEMKPKKDQEESVREVLRKYHVEDESAFLEELKMAKRAGEVTQTKIKVTTEQSLQRARAREAKPAKPAKAKPAKAKSASSSGEPSSD